MNRQDFDMKFDRLKADALQYLKGYHELKIQSLEQVIQAKDDYINDLQSTICYLADLVQESQTQLDSIRSMVER